MALPTIPRWLAVLACLIASAVPGAGLVVCVHDGEIEIGLGDDCPCDLPGDHPECDHLEIDGGGAPVAQPTRVAPRVEWTPAPSVAAAVRPQDAAPAARGGRAPPASGPPRVRCRSAELPWIARHLESRRSTSLVV